MKCNKKMSSPSPASYSGLVLDAIFHLLGLYSLSSATGLDLGHLFAAYTAARWVSLLYRWNSVSSTSEALRSARLVLEGARAVEARARARLECAGQLASAAQEAMDNLDVDALAQRIEGAVAEQVMAAAAQAVAEEQLQQQEEEEEFEEEQQHFIRFKRRRALRNSQR